MHSKNIHEKVLAASARWTGRKVFRHVHGGKVREFNYEDLPRLTFVFARALASRGVQSGDRLILCADNCPEWVLVCLAAFRMGVTVVPVDARSRQSDMEHVTAIVKPALTVLGRMQYGLLRDTVDAARTVVIDELLVGQPADDADKPALTLKAVDPDSPALIVFTSGTSGVAKGVVLSHASISANVMDVVKRFPVDETDRLLSILPLSHMFEFTAGLIGPLLKGACMVYSRVRGPEQLKELLRLERTNVLIGVPAIYQSVLKAIESRIEQLSPQAQSRAQLARRVVSSRVGAPLAGVLMKELQEQFGGPVKFWAAGGAPVPESVVLGLSSFGIPVLAGYGLTEASPIVAANTLYDNRPGSVGKPLSSVTVRINSLDPSQPGDVPTGSPGEIVVRGPSVMTGYFNDEAATNEVLRDDWLYTGDVGHFDADGYLYVTGRIKSTIVTAGGYNIHPEELEKVLDQSPLIKESVVFGVPGAGGETAHALIVPSPAATGRDKDAFRAEIARIFADLAEYKRLTGFELFSGDLPRTRTNKIQRSRALEVYESVRQSAPLATAAVSPEIDADGKLVRQLLLQLIGRDDNGSADGGSADVAGGADAGSADVAGGAELPPSATLAGDLGIDSFSRMELALRLEEAFDIQLSEEAVNDVQTVDELVTLVKARKKRGDGSDSADSAGSAPSSGGAEDESANFDALMRIYASFMETGSRQAQRLSAAVEPWPHGRPAVPRLNLYKSKTMQKARLSLVATMRLALKAYNHYEAVDREKLNIEPPYIVVANHTSHIDTAAIVSAFPLRLVPYLHPVAASDLFFRNQLAAEVSANILNAVSFDRFGDFETSMAACREVLKRGEILIMYPEGTRSTTGRINPFRQGAAQLATAMGCPVIPAYIEGGAQVLAKKGRILKPGKLRITFGDALMPPAQGASSQQIKEFTRQLESAVQALAH